MNKPAPRIAVLTETATDGHIPFVQPHLSAPLQIIDLSLVAKGTELSFLYDAGDSYVTYDGIDLRSVRSVWYRKPKPADDLTLPVAAEYRAYSVDSLRRHANMLKASFQDAFWVSEPYAIHKAGNKAWQMQIAHQVGFQVPDTVITSSQSVAQDFRKRHKDIIIKSLASVFPELDQDFTVIPTMRYAATDQLSLEGLHIAPYIFQECINARVDIRVTVVGDQVFAAAVHDKGIEGFAKVRDSRLNHFMGHTKMAPYTLRSEDHDRCIQLTHQLGLQFGAIDLVVDEHDKTWFLEINPNGQWAFVEQDTGQPIGKALAALLENPPS